MKNSIRQLIDEDQGELTQLVTTNKCLAMEKRQLHRQKLRSYSQKAVKLRGILRETTDPQEKKCIEAKLKKLQEKQDAQIVKLTKIDEIEKEIDTFITEDKESSERIQKVSKRSSLRQELQETPAHRLRTKSSVTYKRGYNDVAVELNFDNSKNKDRDGCSRKSSTDELLLKDSREALEELSVNKLAQSTSGMEKFKKSQNHKYSYYKVQEHKSSSATKARAIKSKYTDENDVLLSFEGVPQIFQDLISKVNQFWPQDCDELVRYFRQSEEVRSMLNIKQKQSRQELRNDDKIKMRKIEEKTAKAENNLSYLIDKERELMERIDKLQRQEKAISKKVDSCMTAIASSYEQVARSSMKFRHKAKNNQQQLLKLSFESFDSYQDSSLLLAQLSKFEEQIQAYVLAGQKQIMLMSGEHQQVSLKLAKSRDEIVQMENKKGRVEQQLSKLDHAVSSRRGMLKQLDNQTHQMQDEAAEISATFQLKKSIAQELDDKIEKLKMKKKSLTDRNKKIEQETQHLTERKHELFQTIIELEQKSVNMKTYQKELETKLIFFERDRQNREKDIKLLEQKAVEGMQRVREINNSYESIVENINSQKRQLDKINEKIENKKEELQIETESVEKMREQINTAKAMLEEQTSLVKKQTEQLLIKTKQLYECQNKISQAKTTLGQILQQIEGETENLSIKKDLVKLESTNIEDLVVAREQLEGILHQVMLKKQQLMSQIEQRSKEFESLLGDLENCQQDYATLRNSLEQFKTDIQDKKKEIKTLKAQWQELRKDLDDELEEQANLITRVNKLKEVERSILLGVGAKGGSAFLDEQLKSRVSEVVGELSSLGQLKIQLKEVKYENRKFRLQNQRLTKLLQG